MGTVWSLSIQEKLPMSLNSDFSQLLLFDDEPIDSILYGSSSNGPTSANAFVDTRPVVDEIVTAICSENLPRALALMQWLLRSDLPVSVKDCTIFMGVFYQLVPDNPWPVLGDEAIEYQSVLDEIILLAERFDSLILLSAAETHRYRLYEGCGEFAKARKLIAKMRERSEKPSSTASLINNYGYEYLLEGNYAKARPYFIESLQLFEQLGNEGEVANAQANLLTCEFELAKDPATETLLPTLIAAHSRLSESGDWRVRKTMRILAARAEAQERILVAVAWARRAVKASLNVETLLQLEDKKYLKRLCRKLKRRKRLAMAYTRDSDQGTKSGSSR
jgi:tetratricopeptide (TPR) repeat protein